MLTHHGCPLVFGCLWAAPACAAHAVCLGRLGGCTCPSRRSACWPSQAGFQHKLCQVCTDCRGGTCGSITATRIVLHLPLPHSPHRGLSAPPTMAKSTGGISPPISRAGIHPVSVHLHSFYFICCASSSFDVMSPRTEEKKMSEPAPTCQHPGCSNRVFGARPCMYPRLLDFVCFSFSSLLFAQLIGGGDQVHGPWPTGSTW